MRVAEHLVHASRLALLDCVAVHELVGRDHGWVEVYLQGLEGGAFTQLVATRQALVIDDVQVLQHCSSKTRNCKLSRIHNNEYDHLQYHDNDDNEDDDANDDDVIPLVVVMVALMMLKTM